MQCFICNCKDRKLAYFMQCKHIKVCIPCKNKVIKLAKKFGLSYYQAICLFNTIIAGIDKRIQLDIKYNSV